MCWLFIFKDTEPSPLQDSFSVLQQEGLPGPPPRSPSPRIHLRPVLTSVCVFITTVPITKLFARGGGGMEDMCYERLRAEAGVN